MNISYLVTCHNETSELEKVLDQLTSHIKNNNLGDEVVVLDDFSDNPNTLKILESYKLKGISVVQHALAGNFGEHKNYGSKRCVGDYIVQLDADEYLAQPLLENIHEIIQSNPTVELYRLPRVNIVRNATTDDARKWGWHVSTISEYGTLPIVNWNSGDYQSRIYKNSPKIQWKKKLHETIFGAEYVSALPKEADYAIIHDKTIERQRSQNEFYNKNWSVAANMGQG